MRYRRLLWLVFVLLFALSGAAFSEPAADGGEGTPVVKVGYVPDTGFFVEDWPGHFSGFGYEFMQSLASNGRHVAHNYYGIDRGWCSSHNSDIWAMANPVGEKRESPEWSNWNLGGA